MMDQYQRRGRVSRSRGDEYKDHGLLILTPCFDSQTQLCKLDTARSDCASFSQRICWRRLQLLWVGWPPMLWNSSMRSAGLEMRKGRKLPVRVWYSASSRLLRIISSSMWIFSSMMSTSLQNLRHRNSPTSFFSFSISYSSCSKAISSAFAGMRMLLWLRHHSMICSTQRKDLRSMVLRMYLRMASSLMSRLIEATTSQISRTLRSISRRQERVELEECVLMSRGWSERVERCLLAVLRVAFEHFFIKKFFCIKSIRRREVQYSLCRDQNHLRKGHIFTDRKD